MASARSDVFANDLQYERINKDRLLNQCIAAVFASLATVNFGYALGFSAEAQLNDAFNEDKVNSTSYMQDLGSESFQYFAVSFSFSITYTIQVQLTLFFYIFYGFCQLSFVTLFSFEISNHWVLKPRLKTAFFYLFQVYGFRCLRVKNCTSL